MKKLWILLLPVILLLTGCAQTQISCGIDGDKNAYMTMEITASWEAAPERDHPYLEYGFEQIRKHYEYKLGFEPEIEEFTATGCHLKMTRRRPGGTYEEAFRELEAMLTKDTITPFMQVQTEFVREGQVEGYGAELTVDAGSFTEAMGIGDLAKDLSVFFQKGLDESTATLTLELPGTEVLDSSGNAVAENGRVKVTVPIDLKGKTTLSLSTLGVTENGEFAPLAQKTLEEACARQEKEFHAWAMATAGAAALLVICLAVFLFVRIGKNKKARKLLAEQTQQPVQTPAEAEKTDESEETEITGEPEKNEGSGETEEPEITDKAKETEETEESEKTEEASQPLT